MDSNLSVQHKMPRHQQGCSAGLKPRVSEIGIISIFLDVTKFDQETASKIASLREIATILSCQGDECLSWPILGNNKMLRKPYISLCGVG
jgi:hypothetical protein